MSYVGVKGQGSTCICIRLYDDFEGVLIMLLCHKLVVLFPLVVLDQEQASTVW